MRRIWLGWALSHYENDKCSHTLQIQTEWTFIMKTLIRLMHCVVNVCNGWFIIKTNWLLFYVGLSIINVSWSVQHSSLENCSHSDNRVTGFTRKYWPIDNPTHHWQPFEYQANASFCGSHVAIFPLKFIRESLQSHTAFSPDTTIFYVILPVQISKEWTKYVKNAKNRQECNHGSIT